MPNYQTPFWAHPENIEHERRHFLAKLASRELNLDGPERTRLARLLRHLQPQPDEPAPDGLSEDEVAARVAAARADIGGILERHLDNETGLQKLIDAGYGDMTMGELYRAWRDGRELPARQELPSFTCPRCGRVSYSPDDIREGYCGHCRDWTGDDAADAAVAQRARESIAAGEPSVSWEGVKAGAALAELPFRGGEWQACGP